MHLYDDHYGPISAIAVYCKTSKVFVESSTNMSEANPGVGRLMARYILWVAADFSKHFYPVSWTQV